MFLLKFWLVHYSPNSINALQFLKRFCGTLNWSCSKSLEIVLSSSQKLIGPFLASCLKFNVTEIFIFVEAFSRTILNTIRLIFLVLNTLVITIPPIFFVETVSIPTVVCLEKNRSNTQLSYFRNFNSQSILLSLLVVGQQEVVSGSHFCLFKLIPHLLIKKSGLGNCK